MAWYPKYRATIQSRGTDWTVDIENDVGSPPAVTTIDIGPDVSIVWGNPTSVGLGPTILSSYSRIQVFDPTDVVFGDLDGADEDVWRVRIYDGTYEWYGHPRLSTLERKVSSTTGYRVLDLYLYDRLKVMDDSESIPVTVNDSTTGFTSLHQVFKTWLVDNCQDLDIVYVMGWFPSNMNASGVSISQIGMSQYYRLSIESNRIEGTPFSGGTRGARRSERSTQPRRSSRSVVRSQGSDRVARVPRGFRAQSSMLEAIEDVANAFFLRVYQDFSGQWIVAQRHTIGEAIASGSRVVSYWNGSTVATSSTTASTVALTDNDISASSIEVKLPRPNLYTVEQDIPNVEELNIIKDSRFEDSSSIGTGSPPNTYWYKSAAINVDPVLDTTPSNAYSGNNSVQLPYDNISGTNPAGVSQSTIWVDGDSKLRVGLRFRANMKNNTGGALDVNMDVKIRVVAGPFATAYWWDGSAWQTSDSNVTITESSVAAAGESGWALHEWEGNAELVTDPLPGSGYLVFEFFGDTGNDDLEVWVDNVEAILISGESPTTAFTSRYPLSGNVYGGEVSHARGFTNLYNFPMMTETAASTWKQTSGWETQEWSDPTDNEYWDLFEVEGIFATQVYNAALKCLRGEYLGIITPNDVVTYSGTDYVVGEGCEIKLKDRVTVFSLAQKQYAYRT